MNSTDEAQSETQAGTVRFAVVIPVYRPTETLLQVISALSDGPVPAIVLVDDGSGPTYREIFCRAEQYAKVRLLRHAVNLGKGAALKTAFNYALCAYPDLLGVVTADADGQHLPDDIEQVMGALAAQPDHLVMGARIFSADVPFRSRFGNAVTRAVMHALVGQDLADTQTGLRGIPAKLLPTLLHMESNGYDFELDMLIAVRQEAMPIAEVPIRTIYAAGNRSSHFNPLIDSMKIYFVLLRFSSVSLMTAALDTLVFYLAYRQLGNIALSQVIGRSVAVAFNYSMVRRAVFFSSKRHISLLPKYLLLVAVSGTASYAGIQLLHSQFNILLLPAKLFVETLLFFANFAIQRDFIFRKNPAEARSAGATPAWLQSWLVQAGLWVAALGLAALVFNGFRAERLLQNSGYTRLGHYRLIHYTKIFWASSLLVVFAFPRIYAPFVVALVLWATVVALGPAAVLAVVIFLLASYALGSLVVEDELCATLAGISVYIFVMTFLVRTPLNYPTVYAVLLAVPLLLNWRRVWRRLAGWGKALVFSKPRKRYQVAAFAVLVYVLGMHWIIIPQPESGADALAMHLAAPADIARHHVFTYRPDRILWSVMPMGADWCYTIVYILGGEFAARLLNFAMLLIVEALLYRMVRRFVSPAIGFILLAVFASSSLVQLVTGSLYIENLLAALVIGMVLAIWEFSDSGEHRYLYCAAVLGGTALATKLGGLAFVIAALPVAIVEVRRRWTQVGRRPVLTSAALLLAAALPAYAIAWSMTRNPVFPFLNQVFPSALLDHAAKFVDYRYMQPLRLSTIYDLTFHTDRYYEGKAGTLGFQYLWFLPLGLIALPLTRKRVALGAAFISLAGMLIVLKTLPNARYLYPVLPLTLIPFAALIGWLKRGALKGTLIGFALICVVANGLLLPASSYWHRDFYEAAPLSKGARQTYIHQYAAIREVGQYMSHAHPGAPVLVTEGSDLAAFDADTYANHWHQYNVRARLHLARNKWEIADILDRWNVHFVVARKPGTDVKPVSPPALQELLASCIAIEFKTNFWYLGRIDPKCEPSTSKREPPFVPPGIYDDFDPALVFDGPWIEDRGWRQPYGHTVSYCNQPGASVRFNFMGHALTYVYTKAFNRGIVDVTIDGIRKATIDLYAPDVSWQNKTTIQLSQGQHTAVITLRPDRNPKAINNFIDLDAFEVQ